MPEQLILLLERLPLEVVPAWGARALELVRDYKDRPMDVADACLVALAEEEAGRVVATVDESGFSIYRMHGRQRVPTVMPTR